MLRGHQYVLREEFIAYSRYQIPVVKNDTYVSLQVIPMKKLAIPQISTYPTVTQPAVGRDNDWSQI